MTETKTNAPLTPIVFNILLAIADEALHGYALMKAVEENSGGRVAPGPGTIYGALERMETAGLVREIETPERRKRVFAITPKGRAALATEAEHIRDTANLLKGKGIVGGTT